MTIPITGVGPAPINQEEKTSQKLLDDYLNLMKQIQEIFNKPVLTESDYKNLQTAMEALKKLAQEGDSTSSPGMIYYMPKDMLTKLNAVFSVLSAGGITLNGTGSIDEMLLKMKLIQETTNTIDGKPVRVMAYILSDAIGNLAGPTQNLQDMLYNDFVIGANDALEKKLEALEEQLQLTTKVTELLKKFQEFRNRLISSPAGAVYDDKGVARPVGPVIGELKIPEDLEEFIKYRDELQKLLDQFPQVDENGKPIDYGEGTAPQALRKVLNDINGLKSGESEFKNINLDTVLKDKDVAKNCVEKWLKNNVDTNNSYKAGPYADNLTHAMTAIQSLSDTQKEELRSTLYIYEQFMKIAGELLSTIKTLTERPAQSIAG